MGGLQISRKRKWQKGGVNAGCAGGELQVLKTVLFRSSIFTNWQVSVLLSAGREFAAYVGRLLGSLLRFTSEKYQGWHANSKRCRFVSQPNMWYISNIKFQPKLWELPCCLHSGESSQQIICFLQLDAIMQGENRTNASPKFS
jgi:hypothetical protein